MIRTIFAKLAKTNENKASFKINKKICIALSAVIAISTIGITATKLSSSADVKVLAEGEYETIESVSQIPTSETSESVLDTTYNNINFCKVTIVKHAKTTQTVILRKDTVSKALDSAKVVVGKYDVLNCKLSDTIYDGMKIIINEVKYKNESSSKKMSLDNFKKRYPGQDASKLDKNGKVKVNKTVEVKYVNGVRTSKKLKSISYKSVDIYTKYSSLKTISELKPSKELKLDKNGIPVNYKSKITGVASAYSCGTHTATGKRVQPGYIAVNPRQIPYGTKLYIRSSDGNYIYGYASAEDTGGFVAWGNTLADLFFWSESDCRQFGRRSIEIYVLN